MDLQYKGKYNAFALYKLSLRYGFRFATGARRIIEKKGAHIIVSIFKSFI